MAKTSTRTLNNAIRAQVLERLIDFFKEQGEDVVQTGTGELAFPCLDAERNDKWVKIKISVPTGPREVNADGTKDEFDGDAIADAFKASQEEKRIKDEEKEKAKQTKIARDEAKRKAKTEAKTE